MSRNDLCELQQEIRTFYSETLGRLAESYGASYSELLDMWQELHSYYLETTAAMLQQWAEKYDALNAAQTNVFSKIEADSIITEIIDKDTGRIFRRSLPVKYFETDNGVVLSGETIEGSPSQIALYSEAALAKIHDLLGKGPDSHRCDET